MVDRSSAQPTIRPREILPFAAAAIICLLVALLPGPETDWALFWTVMALTVAILVAGLVAALLRRGRVLNLLLPLACFAVIALLQHSGTTTIGASGFVPLVMLPIVWLAMFGSRRDLLVGLAGLAVALLGPFLVFGEPRYPATAWRSAVMWLTVAALTGLSIKSLVVRLRTTRDRLSGVLNASTEIAFIATDPQGLITVFNTGAERMLGYRADEMVGRFTLGVLHDPEELAAHMAERGIEPGFEMSAESVRRDLPEYHQWTFIRKDGTRTRVGLTMTAEFAPDGSISGFLGVAKDVSARVEAEAARQQALESAIDASRAKSEFLANMSHEIRTPLNGVIGMLELLMDTNLTPDQREYARTAAVSGDALLGVINDVLDFSKIEAGKLEIDIHDLDPRAVVDDVCGMLAHQAHVKGVELTAWIDEQMPPVVRGDGGRVRQVVTNLVSNAIKFTQSGEVCVRAGAAPLDDGDLLLDVAVTDTGIGIAPEPLQALFVAFSQADNSTTRRFGGTGLGLAISRQLVELMGGELTATSEPGKGSTFRFTVRVKASTAERPARGQRLSLPDGLRVLVVDDSRTNRDILRGYLDPRVTRCEEAGTAHEALLLLHAAASAGEPYELVVLDLQMPGMDGLELAQAIRKAPSLRGARLIVLASTTAHRAAAQEARIDGCLTKPVRRASLLEAIADVFAPERATPAPADPQPRPLAHAPGAPGALRILVVEDNPVNQLVMKGMLAKRGYEVDLAAGGAEALEQFDPDRYAAVFMDVQMPGLDGYATTRGIRAGEDARGRTPIVAMTAGAIEGDRDRALAAGMDDYMTKPVRADQLDAVLERWAGGAAVASPAAAAEPLVDDSRIRRFLEDYPEIVDQLVALFEASTPPLLERLAEAAAKDDHAAVRSLAHKLRGSAGNIGASQMAALCRAMEQPGARHTPLVDELTAAYRATVDEIHGAVAASHPV